MKMKFGIASMSLFPLPLHTILRKASKAGFDFVEVFLVGKWNTEKVAHAIERAALLGLELHFHQVWTTQSSQAKDKRVNQVLTLFGILPPDRYKLNEWIPENARPLVAYADRIPELVGQDGIWFQSIAEQRSLKDPTPRLSCPDFRERIRRGRLDIVFDTMHYIEYLRGESGIERCALNTLHILAEWEKFWTAFSAQVREIHWNDFSRERNLWPGTGMAPLREFAQIVQKSGWNGCVVPEVRPQLPLPYEAKDLLELRKKMGAYFR